MPFLSPATITVPVQTETDWLKSAKKSPSKPNFEELLASRLNNFVATRTSAHLDFSRVRMNSSDRLHHALEVIQSVPAALATPAEDDQIQKNNIPHTCSEHGELVHTEDFEMIAPPRLCPHSPSSILAMFGGSPRKALDGVGDGTGLVHLSSSATHRTTSNATLPSISISFSHNELDEELRRKLLRETLFSASKKVEINGLDIYGIGLTDADVPHVLHLLRSPPFCHNMMKLKMGDNHLSSEGLSQIILTLSSSGAALNQLHLGGNKLGDEGIEHIANLLSKTKIDNLGLRDVGMTSTGAVALAKCFASVEQPQHSSLPPVSMLVELQLRENNFGDKGFSVLAATLPQSLQILDLQGNDLSCASVSIFASHARTRHTQLRELLMNKNRVGNTGAAALADFLSTPGIALTSLEVSSNDIGPEGARKLFLGVAKNRSLSSIAVSKNPIGVGAEALVDVLCSFASVIDIDISDCNIPAKALSSILEEASLDDSSLKELDFSKNYVGHGAVPALCQMLKKNTTITRLLFTDNDISESEMPMVCDAADHNTTIRYMKFGGQSKQSPKGNALPGDLRSRFNTYLDRNRELCAKRKKAWREARSATFDEAQLLPSPTPAEKPRDTYPTVEPRAPPPPYSAHKHSLHPPKPKSELNWCDVAKDNVDSSKLSWPALQHSETPVILSPLLMPRSASDSDPRDIQGSFYPEFATTTGFFNSPFQLPTVTS